MRKNEYGRTSVSEYSVHRVHCRLQIGRVHQNVVRKNYIELRIADGPKFSTGINSEIEIGMTDSGDLNHALR